MPYNVFLSCFVTGHRGLRDEEFYNIIWSSGRFQFRRATLFLIRINEFLFFFQPKKTVRNQFTLDIKTYEKVLVNI
jgi:hypothetical protein